MAWMFLSGVRPLRRHLLQLTLLGLIPLVVFAALAITNAARAHRVELERSTLDLSRALSNAVQAQLDAAALTLANMARTAELQRGDIAAVYERATGLAALNPGWAGLALSDANGKVLFRTGGPLGKDTLQPVEAASLETTIRTARLTIGRATPGTRRPITVAVRYPVVQDGRVIYVLTAVLVPDPMVAMLQRQRVPESWIISVLDSELQIFARSKNQEQFALKTATESFRKLVGSGGSEGTGILTSLEGTSVITGFSRIPDYNWFVAVGAPSTPLASFFTPTLALFLVGVGGSLLICALLALRTAERITSDIAHVTDAAAALGDARTLAIDPSAIEEINRLRSALGEAGERLAAAHVAQVGALNQAREAGRAKDEFLAVLGHELRNPLAPIVSAMYLLDSRSDERTARERAILRRQVDHMRRLVDDLLDVARITRGKVEIQAEPVDVRQVLTEVIDDLRQAHPAAQIVLHADVQQAWVRADAPRLAQVFTNVLANALRYGGGLPIDVRLAQVEGQVRISVEDRGEGMNEQTLARAFEPFYQASHKGDAVNGSLGLGLAIVKAIIEAHGGTASAHSAGLGQGSRFDIGLPALAKSA